MPSTATYTVPIQRVRAFADVATGRGWDLEAVLHDAGISPVLLSDGRSRITIEQFSRLFRGLRRATDDELLGLGLEPIPRGSFRLLCYALLSAATLGDALERFEKVVAAVPGFPATSVLTGDATAEVVIDLSGVEQPVDTLVDTFLALTHRFIGWAVDRRVALRRVDVPYAEQADVDDYGLIFAAPVRFSAGRAALVYDVKVLGLPVVRDESSLDSFLRGAPASLLTYRTNPTSTADAVRRLLEKGLSGEWMSVDDVASELAMSPQTLRRKLRDENTTTRSIREQILRDAAIASLVRGDETVTALARRLGFSEPSAFSRAFSRWTGSPPGSYQPPG